MGNGFSGSAILVQSVDQYNVLQLIAIFVLIFWAHFAWERLLDTLLVRAAILTNQQVVIRGLGSMLSIFRLTQPHHSDSVLQTRLRAEAVPISATYCPVSLKALSVVRDTGNGQARVSFQLWAATNCEVLIGLNVTRKMVSDSTSTHNIKSFLHMNGAEVVHERQILAGDNDVEVLFPTRSGTLPVVVVVDNLDHMSISLQEDLSGSIAQATDDGVSTTSSGTAARYRTQRDGDELEGWTLNPAHWLVDLFPVGGSAHAAGQDATEYDGVVNTSTTDTEFNSTHSRTSLMDIFSGRRGGDGGSVGGDGASVLEDGNSRKRERRGGLLGVDRAFYLSVLGDTATSCAEATMLLSVKDHVYEPLEVFGMESSSPSVSSLSPSQGGSGSSAAPAAVVSGLGIPGNAEEECVVCLANEKEVLLLPCRHLCVCRECFVMIDKCPVCRSAFEEYVKMHKEKTNELLVPRSAVLT